MPAERAHTTRLVTRGEDRPAKQAFLLAFGRRLRSRRLAAGLSQDRLAARCFLRARQVVDLEGGRTMPQLDVLLLLRDALGVSLAELTDGLAAPIRGAGRAEILALVAQEPGSNIKTMAKRSGLPETYVSQIARYLEATGHIERMGGGWRLGAAGGNPPDRG